MDGAVRSPVLKVAAIQFSPDFVVPLHKEGADPFLAKRDNLQRLARLIEEAAENGASLIVLPELCTTGYTFMSAIEARPHAEVVADGPTTMVMKALAVKHNVHIVWGMAEIDPNTNHLYNTQVYVDPFGYLDSYRKINPWGNDYLWAKPGRANPPIINARFELDGGNTYKFTRVGLLICRDVRDKKDSSWSSFYSKGDANIVCLSANWGDGGFPAVSWMDFVEDNGCALIVANRYGQEGPNNFGEGGSCFIEASGEVHCEGLKWSQDCVVYGHFG